ncbi:MAG: iron ion binding protein [Parcubacteria group bacterium Gr01-1014_56]|nr:MAG: iron ion binding protein [Parcubacteria group bacterium Gr01-1014_56]
MTKAPLRDFRTNVTSSQGEDGMIAELFRRIGTHNKWCVEFGALNGTHDSNVWALINKKEWSGVLIEADRTYFEKLVEAYRTITRATCLNLFVSFEGEHSLDAIFLNTPLPKDFDLMSIDIDGNDYHVWESLKEYQPRVVIVEFNPTIPNDIAFVQPRDMSVQQGSSLLAFVDLAQKKGYTLVATTGANAFFVLTSLAPMLGFEDLSIETLHPDTEYYTRLYQLFDGTLVLDGYKELMWHRISIDEEKIQVLPPSKRAYPAGLSAHTPVRNLKYWIRKSPLYTLIKRIRSRYK